MQRETGHTSKYGNEETMPNTAGGSGSQGRRAAASASVVSATSPRYAAPPPPLRPPTPARAHLDRRYDHPTRPWTAHPDYTDPGARSARQRHSLSPVASFSRYPSSPQMSSTTARAHPDVQPHYGVHQPPQDEVDVAQYWPGAYAHQQQQQQQTHQHHAGSGYDFGTGILDVPQPFHARSGASSHQDLQALAEGAYAMPSYRLHSSSQERSTVFGTPDEPHAPPAPVASTSRLPPVTPASASTSSSRQLETWVTDVSSTQLQDTEDMAAAPGRRGRGLAMNPSSEPSHEMAEAGSSAGGSAASRKKARSARARERLRIELAPDQPPTTQGKQRERVYVACNQCRSRKIRCDGGKPMCFNCRQRGIGVCEFDTEPKRRGPDRQPGARQRQGSTVSPTTARRTSRAARSVRGVRSEDVHPADRADDGTTPQTDKPPAPPSAPFDAARDSEAIAPLPRVVPPLAPLFADARSSGPLPIHTPEYPGSAIDLPALHAAAPLSYAHSGAETLSKVLRSQAGAHPHSAVFVVSPPPDLGYTHDPGVQVVAHQSAPALFVHPHELPLRTTLLTPPNSAVDFRRQSKDSQISFESSVSPPSICSSETSIHVSHFPQPAIVDPEIAVGHPAYADLDSLSLQSAHLIADDLYNSSAELLKADHHVHVVHAPVAYEYNPYQWAVDQADETETTAYITPVEDDFASHGYSIAQTPSLEFIRKTWWDSLLDTYCAETYCTPMVTANYKTIYGLSVHVPHGTVPAGSMRIQVSDIVVRDLQSVFRDTNYWFAFINVPLFFETFFRQRDAMQPALMLALLMHANFLRSSNAELGEEGRSRTFWLREKAQGALDASINAGWLDPGLAQAAWLLTVFEISAQPKRKLAFINSSLKTLDGIMSTLGITSLDADETASEHHRHASHILPLPLYNRQPMSQLPQAHLPPPATSQLLQYHAPHTSAAAAHAQLQATMQAGAPGCACAALSLGRNWREARTLTPFWLCTPAWSASWSAAEVRREECRRLCWNTLCLVAGYTTYRASMGMSHLDLAIVQPLNYRNVFPGENLTDLSSSLDGSRGPAHFASETVWALYTRAMLLWHACLRIRDVTITERAVFAQTVWLEADAIERALDTHTCQTERAFLFQGREYLFNSRMYVSNEFRRYVPHPSPDMIGSVHRQKAEEWLTHQAELSKRVMNGLQTVTGMPGNVLCKRPFFVFWFMGHVSRCLQLWRLDHELAPALELSKSFLRPIEYLTTLWPCDDQLQNYLRLRRALENACAAAGLSPPPPLDLTPPNALP